MVLVVPVVLVVLVVMYGLVVTIQIIIVDKNKTALEIRQSYPYTSLRIYIYGSINGIGKMYFVVWKAFLVDYNFIFLEMPFCSFLNYPYKLHIDVYCNK